MLAIARGEDSVVVAPEHGGALVGWTRRRVHLLRHPSPEAVLLGEPGSMGCFPLVPYCNRIADRSFHWAGRTYQLAANFGDRPHAIHGVGWRRPWRVEQAAADSVTLSLRHDPTGEDAGAWPFAFAALLTYALSESGLTITLEATNAHAAPAPMGIGAHPYFPRPPAVALTFQANGVWLNRRDALPVSHAPVPSGWNHAAGRVVDGEPLDNCFTGWRGEATSLSLKIAADAVFGNLQVFTPAGADFLCVEPVSHVPDAINRAGLGAGQAMAVLAPGGTLRGSMTFTPIGAAA